MDARVHSIIRLSSLKKNDLCLLIRCSHASMQLATPIEIMILRVLAGPLLGNSNLSLGTNRWVFRSDVLIRTNQIFFKESLKNIGAILVGTSELKNRLLVLRERLEFSLITFLHKKRFESITPTMQCLSPASVWPKVEMQASWITLVIAQVRGDQWLHSEVDNKEGHCDNDESLSVIICQTWAVPRLPVCSLNKSFTAVCLFQHQTNLVPILLRGQC